MDFSYPQQLNRSQGMEVIDLANLLAMVGLVLNLIGVLLLFKFGLPPGIRTGGGDVITTRPTEDRLRKEQVSVRWSYLGLFFIVVGTFLQFPALANFE